MHPVEILEMVIAMFVAILALSWVAERLRLPPSVALLCGGSGLAFLPGMPTMHLDPDLVLALFLPPLLADGAWSAAILHFRRHFVGILSLAVGAVLFTTFVVAVVAHWMLPSLPWAACAALGAIVSPPDAVSARAVLSRVRLPRRLSTLLEGESMLNDASGLVLFRFAVVAATGGTFSLGAGLEKFAVLAIGGAAVGGAIGWAWAWVMRRVLEDDIVITSACLVCWISYFIGEKLGVSGVIATVAAGMVLGWSQHSVMRASTRIRGVAFWRTMIFLLEATVFMLIGFSLRAVLERVGGFGVVWHQMSGFVLAIVLAMTLARFVWVYGSDAVVRLLRAVGVRRYPPLGGAEALVLSWAGMRGVVSLAVALTLPETMPGRDIMLVAAFGVIVATVVLQGMTLGLAIRCTGLRPPASDRMPLTLSEAEVVLAEAQLEAVRRAAYGEDGALIHPRLLDQYERRASVTATYAAHEDEHHGNLVAHFDVVLAATRAGREALLRLYRTHRIDSEMMADLEHDLDLEELGAVAAKGQHPAA